MSIVTVKGRQQALPLADNLIEQVAKALWLRRNNTFLQASGLATNWEDAPGVLRDATRDDARHAINAYESAKGSTANE